jgi:hypothetical protein
MWVDATEAAIGITGEWTNKVDLADIDADGDVDILFANGGDYDEPGTPVVNQIFANDGSGVFADVTSQVVGPEGDLARVIKARDLDGDGLPDIIVGTTFETQSRLYLNRGGLDFEEVTTTHLPAVDSSVGDLEVGDVDADGDLDLVLADWGPGDPMRNDGAPVRLWLNDGNAVFSEAPAGQVPQPLVLFSWDLELVDVDNDFDLDILTSCKRCAGGFLFRNNGAGVFEDESAALPQATNNYDFEPMDVDGDGFLDLVTVNDGPDMRERLLMSDGMGGFVDHTMDRWPEEANMAADDNVVAFADVDSDGDADFIIGSLSGSDRLMVNDGSGHLSMDDQIFKGVRTLGTLGLAMADLNGDTRIDVVQAQGEAADREKVLMGGDLVPPDSAPPIITNVRAIGGTIHARVHDNKSPSVTSDWRSVVLRGPAGDQPMQWYGEYLWRATPAEPGSHSVCATDHAGNESCSAVVVS